MFFSKNTSSIKFYAIGENSFSAGRNYLSLDQVKNTVKNYANVTDIEIAGAVGEMLNGSIPEDILTSKYGTNRTELTLDLTATFCGRCINFKDAGKQGPNNYIMGITSLRTRGPSADELGYLAVSHGDFDARTPGYDLQAQSFPNEVWISWANNHDLQSIQLYHEDSSAHKYLWFANERKKYA